MWFHFSFSSYRIIASLFLDIDMILEIGSCRNLELFVSFQYYTSRVSVLRKSNHSVLVRFHSKSEDFEFVLTVKKKKSLFLDKIGWLGYYILRLESSVVYKPKYRF